ncbi:MAG: S-layer homology domain-containing protein, partial [Oscillospiraceae bacterium]|nr:S-layer homology domain-containing protein [Oscillospiraceae bacterium]
LTIDNEEPEAFKDVTASDWFCDVVDYVSAKGLMIGTGKGTFSPNATVSNAMAWMILARINEAYTMSEGNWYDAAQSFVVTNGLSDGINPDGAITREAFITMLFKSNGHYCVRDLGMYADAGSISESAVDPMRWAVEEGIIKGENGKLNPKGYMTRAELAEILMRLG